MLEITGSIGDKTYNAEPVSAKFLMETYNIPPIDKYAEFRVTPERMKVDHINGGFQVPPSTGLPTVANINITGKSISLRWCSTRTPGPNGAVEYAPRRLSDLRGQMVAFTDKNEEEVEKYVYFYLHPLNASSPAHREGREAFYFLYDRTGEADKLAATYTMLSDLGKEIMTIPEARLRIKASGLFYRNSGGNVMVDATKAVELNELRVRLSELLHADKTLFADAWRNEENALRGTIKYAIEKGILVGVNNPSQGTTWKWSNAEGGGEVTIASRNDDPTIAILNYIAQNYTYMVPKLTSAINRMESAEMPMPGVFEDVVDEDMLTAERIKEMQPLQLIQFAASQDVLYFDRPNFQVYYCNESGDVDGDPIFTVLDKTKWQAEYAEFLADGLNVNHLKILRQKVTEKKFDRQTAYFGSNPGKPKKKNK